MRHKTINGWKEDFIRLAFPEHKAKDIAEILKVKIDLIRRFAHPNKLKKEPVRLENGTKIKKLTVLELLPTKGKKNLLYRCQCECGKIVNIRSSLLKKGSIKSCDRCYKKQSRIDSYAYKETNKAVWSRMMSHAYERGIEFNIKIEELYDLLLKQDKKCKLSGLPISLDCNSSGDKKTASLDRIDKNKPYEKGNVQWVHKKINFMKNSLSDEEFIEMCQIVTINQSKGVKTT